MNRKPIVLAIITAVILAGPAIYALADQKVIEDVTVEMSPAGKSGESAQVITWISELKYARVDELNHVTTILRKDLNKMYMVLHDSREVIDIDLPFRLPDNLKPLFDETEMTWDLNRFPEKRQIGNWPCTKVLITGRGIINVDMELWVTTQTSIDTRAYTAMVGEALKSSAIYKAMSEKLDAIAPSFAIETTTTVEQIGLRARTVSRVRSIEETEVPESVFELPEGYDVKPLNFSTYLSLIAERQPSPATN